MVVGVREGEVLKRLDYVCRSAAILVFFQSIIPCTTRICGD